MLTRVAEGLHVVAAPQRFLFLELGTRMTVIELEGGGVALHSPVPFDAHLADEVARIGEVRCVIAPNVFHHLHVGPWLAASPGAVLCAPEGLRKKRPDLPRPYRCTLYPLSPALFILVSIAFVAALLYDPTERTNALFGLGILASGIPYYLWWTRSRRSAA